MKSREGSFYRDTCRRRCEHYKLKDRTSEDIGTYGVMNSAGPFESGYRTLKEAASSALRHSVGGWMGACWPVKFV